MQVYDNINGRKAYEHQGYICYWMPPLGYDPDDNGCWEIENIERGDDWSTSTDTLKEAQAIMRLWAKEDKS